MVHFNTFSIMTIELVRINFCKSNTLLSLV